MRPFSKSPVWSREALAAALAVSAVACRGREAPPTKLRVGLGYGIASIDPHAERTFASFEQLSNVYEPLTVLDADLRARPALALSWDNPDPLTWEFQLRPDVVFHDGSPFAADDVVYSYTRLMKDESLKLRSYLSSVSLVSARGSHVVVVKTSWPNAQLLSGLSFVPIVRKGATKASLEAQPNGTGPWRLLRWERPARLELERSGRYWGQKAAFDRVEVTIGLTRAAALFALDAGLHDVLRYATPDVEEKAARGTYRVTRTPNIYLRHLGFDVSRETTPFVPGIPNPFRRREVREAIQLALDVRRLAARVDAQALPAEQLVPRAVFGHEPGVSAPAQDLAKARRLMEGVGLGSGFDVTLHRSGFETAANVVAEQLGEIGIRVRVVELPSAGFFEALSRHELSFWIVANGCASGDAMEVLWSSFHTPDASRGAGVDNHAGYSSAEFDLACEEAARSFEPELRLPALQRALRVARSDLVWIPLYYSNDVFIVSKTLAFTPRADGMLRYSDFHPAAR